MSYAAKSSSPHYQIANVFSPKPIIEIILIIQWSSNPDEASVNQIKVDKPMMYVESTPA